MSTPRYSRRQALSVAALAGMCGASLAACSGEELPVVVSGTGSARRQEAYRVLVEQAMGPVERLWGTAAVPVPVHLVCPASTSRWASVTGLPAETDDVPAVVAHVDSMRQIVIHPLAYDRLSSAGLLVVLTHETTHLAQPQGSEVPWWLLEGSAEFTTYLDRAQDPREIWLDVWDSLLQLAPTLETLPQQPISGAGALPSAFPDRDFAYASAWSVCLWMAQRSGAAEVVPRFYRALSDGVTLGAAAESEWGLNEQEMMKAWAQWLAAQAFINQ